MNGRIACPACRCSSVETVISVDVAPTSDGMIVKYPVDTTVCMNCGFAFNASGARGHEQSFYSESYNLLAESAEAEFIYDTRSGSRGINDEMAEYLIEYCRPKAAGRVLDVGCGKGLLLRALARRRGDLKLYGVEPSRHAHGYSQKIVPEASIFEGVLSKSPYASQAFDLVISVGVFEHVPDPVGFAAELASVVLPGGWVFVSVPNLAKNPADVVTFDHLSRFTPATFRSVLARAGLSVEALVSEDRVPMWALARRLDAPATDSHLDSGSIPRAAVQWFESCLVIYRELGRAKSQTKKIGVYGTGLILPSAVALGALGATDIAAFFDDNTYMHGSERLGRGVYPLAAARSLGITDMTFSANPVYLPRMLQKVRSLDANISCWPLPTFNSLVDAAR